MQDAGTVKKLSVAVVVDGTYTTDAGGTRTYAPRSEADMANITALVRSAIGFNETRGDQVQVTNMRFAEPDAIRGETRHVRTVARPRLHHLAQARPDPDPVDHRAAGLPAGRQAADPAPDALRSARRQRRRDSYCLRRRARRQLPRRAAGQPGTTAQIGAGAAPAALPKRESMIDISQIEGQVRESSIRKIGEVVQRAS